MSLVAVAGTAFVRRGSASESAPAGAHPRTIHPDTIAAARAEIISSGPSAGLGLRWQTAITQYGTTSAFSTGNLDMAATWWVALQAHMRAEGDLGLTWAADRATYVSKAITRAQFFIDRATGYALSDPYDVYAVAGVYDFLYEDLTSGQRTAYNDFLENATHGNLHYTTNMWDDQSAGRHIANLTRHLACEDHAARFAAAVTATQLFAGARTHTAFNSLGYEWKDSYPANTTQAMSLWTLRQYDPSLTDADTYDHYVYHLQNAAQLLRQMTIPHPGLLSPVPMKTNQVQYNTLYYRLGLVPAHILWAFHVLPGRVHLAADDGIRALVTDNEADQSTLANNEADLLSYLKFYWDEQSLGATTGNNRPLNYASANGLWNTSPGVHTWATVMPWLLENTELPASAKSGEDAGIPLARRWWPGTLDYTTITNSHTIQNSTRSLISFWHKRYFCGNYEGNCHYNGGWQAHRAGPLYGMGGVDSHSVVSRRQTPHHNGTFNFYDDAEHAEFETVVNDNYSTGGVRLATSAQSPAEYLASPANDFGRVTKWWSDSAVTAITSDLTKSYHTAATAGYPGAGNPARLTAFTKEWICVRRGAESTGRDHIFVYDRIELTDSKYWPRLNLNCCVDPDIDGTETAHTPWDPTADQSLTSVDWEATGPTRWDYTDTPTRLVFDNLTEPATTGTGPSGAVHSVPGNGKTITKILQPAVMMRKRGGFNAEVLGDPTNTYNGAPWFAVNGAWIQGEGEYPKISDANKPAHHAYIMPWVVEVIPTAVSTTHRYLYVTDLMDGDDTIDEGEHVELTCDVDSVAARSGAAAVSIAKDEVGRDSGEIEIPSGVTFVVIQGLTPNATVTLTPEAGLTIESLNRVASNTGVLHAELSGDGLLEFAI